VILGDNNQDLRAFVNIIEVFLYRHVENWLDCKYHTYLIFKLFDIIILFYMHDMYMQRYLYICTYTYCYKTVEYLDQFACMCKEAPFHVLLCTSLKYMIYICLYRIIHLI